MSTEQTGQITFPRMWKQKKTGKMFRALPWWECLDPIVTEKDFNFKMKEYKDRKLKIGVIIQIGWLLENEHMVWFGVNFDAAKMFKDLGEWKKK